MPTFGEYETIGEPIATIEERGHLTTVWQARKSGAAAGELYAIKCYAPRNRKQKDAQGEDALDEDRGLEFLEGIKEQKKAQNEGGRCLAPIHAFGIAGEGVWYVTDFYPRNNLKTWIARRGGVDSAALRHVLHSVVTGCLALKQSRGHSHGNLKTGNVFLVGKPRPLAKTPLHLTDPYPAAPLQLSRMDAVDRKTVGDLLGQVVEIQDLKAIGELILQLVEGRIITNAYDYNYPIGPSKAWEAVGDAWRQRCNQLLDPQLSLDRVNLEALEREFRPRLITPKRMIVSAVVVCAVAGGIYFGISAHNKSVRIKEEARKAQEQLAIQNFDKSIQAGNALMEADQANYPQAAIEFHNALKSAEELNDPARKKAADESERYAGALAQAQGAARIEDVIKALDDAVKIKQEPKIQARLADARRQRDLADKQQKVAQLTTEFGNSMASGNALLAKSNYAQADVEFQRAVKIAGELNDSDKRNTADKAHRNANALAQAGEAVTRTIEEKKLALEKAAAAGNTLMAEGDYAKAMVEFQRAGKLAGELNDAATQKTANENERFASALAQAKAAGRIEDQIKSLDDALKIKDDPKVRAWRAETEKTQREKAQTDAMAQQKAKLDGAMAEGNRLLGQGEYALAAVEFRNAVTVAGDLGDADKKKSADDSQRFATALANAKAAKTAGRIDDEIQSLDEAQKIKKDTKVDTWVVEAKRHKEQMKAVDTAIAEGNRLLEQTNYARAIVEFQKAGKTAGELNDAGRQKIAEDGQLFANTLMQAKSASNVDEEIRLLKEAIKIRRDTKVEGLLLAAQRRKAATTPTAPTNVVSLPSTRPASTNLFGIDFAWVPGVRGSGAYVATTELSHAQFRSLYDKLGKNGQSEWQTLKTRVGQRAETSDDSPITLMQTDAAGLVDSANQQKRYPGKFVLPTFEDFLIFAKVEPGLVDRSTGRFAGDGAAARKYFGDTSRFWTGIGEASPGDRSPRKVKEGVANTYGLFHTIGNAWEWSDETGYALGLAATSEAFGSGATLKRKFLAISECISVRLEFIPAAP